MKRYSKLIAKYIAVLQKRYKRSEITKLSLILAFLIPFYAILYKIYIPYANSFGCFDDCMNFIGGYFMQYGKQPYSSIFLNHQPMMDWISYLIQITSNPQNIYEFMLRHMQFTLLFGFIFNILIIRRFGLAGVGFVVVYELSKYYIFGQRFLAESYIVYPLVYMTGLVWLKLRKGKLYDWEYIATALFTWFVLYSREPYVPLVFFLYTILLWLPTTTIKKVSLILFFVLSLVTLLLMPIKDYFFSVWIVTYNSVLAGGHTGNFREQILPILFYPISVLFFGKWNEFRLLLVGLSITFLILSAYIMYRKKYKLFMVLFLILGFANIRYLEPGNIFFEAFHLVPWYGIFVFIIFTIIFQFEKKRVFFRTIPLLVIFGFFLAFLFHPKVFFRNLPDRQSELLMNYGRAMQIGEVVRILSQPHQTFFIDFDDDTIMAYWQSKRDSPYKYSWYGFIAPGVKEYDEPRTEMFLKNPPDFYYGDVIRATRSSEMPIDFSKTYQVLYPKEDKANLYIKRELIGKIPNEKWRTIETWGFKKDSGDIEEP